MVHKIAVETRIPASARVGVPAAKPGHGVGDVHSKSFGAIIRSAVGGTTPAISKSQNPATRVNSSSSAILSLGKAIAGLTAGGIFSGASASSIPSTASRTVATSTDTPPPTNPTETTITTTTSPAATNSIPKTTVDPVPGVTAGGIFGFGVTSGTPAPPPPVDQIQAAEDRYWAQQPPEVQQLKNITDDAQRAVVGRQLALKGYKIDYPIMILGWNAAMTMQQRQQAGYTWVPNAMQNTVAIAPGMTMPGVPSYDPNNPPPGSIIVDTSFINP